MSVLMRLGTGFTTVLLLAACSSGGSSGGGGPATLVEACEAHTDIDGVNRVAIAMSSSVSANNGNACQELHQYNLFAPNEDEGFLRGDPRRPLVVEGEYQGLPYVLNTALFSDYTAKHRIVFLPRDENGDFIPATYRDAGSEPDGTPGTGDLPKANDNFLFPVGTVIAKTFTYPDASAPGGAVERVIETRLLIKHTNTGDGSERWEGVAYFWERDETTDEWIAYRLNRGTQVGDDIGVFDEERNWHYPDPNDPDLTISGTAAEGEDLYLIPSRDNCLTCHSNADQDAGAAPIGLKARYLNRPYASEFDTFTNDPVDLVDSNQIDYWAAQGWLSDVEPQAYTLDTQTGVITDIERIQPYNIPGDDTDPEADLAARARGYLEVNCAHCHNEMRRISPTGVPSAGVEDFYLEFQRAFCSQNFFDQGNIAPGDAEGSDLYKRINTPGDEQVNAGGGDPMPRLARQLIHAEGVAVIGAWIDNMPTDICEP